MAISHIFMTHWTHTQLTYMWLEKSQHATEVLEADSTLTGIQTFIKWKTKSCLSSKRKTMTVMNARHVIT